MQRLLESLSPIERRLYWRWCLMILAFYVLLVIAGGAAVLMHRSAVAWNARPPAHVTSGRVVTEKSLPQLDISDIAPLIAP
jgi:hypothetical protein